MNRLTIFRAIALLNFIVLFTIFLLHRNGSFNKSFYKNSDNNFTSSNGGFGAKETADSVIKVYDSLRNRQKIRLSSSKSLVITDFSYKRPITKIPKKDSTLVYLTEKEKEIMQRSKQGVKTESSVRLFILDSLLKEKVKQKEQP